ncbi:MAG: hypothetical protein U0736_08705 [Gemmataceae bacterium]
MDDELYFHQDGDEPIEPLLAAESKVTRRLEPLAWTYSYGKGQGVPNCWAQREDV